MADVNKFDGILTRLEEVTGRLENASVAFAGAIGAKKIDRPAATDASDDGVLEIPPAVYNYDEAVKQDLEEFLKNSQSIGNAVSKICSLAKEAFDCLRLFLWKSAGMPKPSDQQLQTLLAPLSDAIRQVISFKESSPRSDHLAAISEAIAALGWVTVSPTPVPYIKEVIDAAKFYTNRVLKEYKDKDKVHTDWVKAWLRVLEQLQQYVKKNHTTGLVWNTSAGASPSPASMTPNSIGGVSPQGAPAPPPPPPPPPPEDFAKQFDATKNANDKEKESRAALFADLNKGLDITQGLKKVTDDMKTHKNPALRSKQDAPPPIAPKPEAVKITSQDQLKKEHKPRLELEMGKRWVVEYYKSKQDLVLEIESFKQVVYIYKCEASMVTIKGKVNTVILDSCNKTSILVDDVVSMVEIINCQRAALQSLGSLPTVAIQKTDGCQIYLNEKSLGAEILTSKASEVNVSLPVKDKHGEDFAEYAVPELFKTLWDGKKLVTTAMDIS